MERALVMLRERGLKGRLSDGKIVERTIYRTYAGKSQVFWVRHGGQRRPVARIWGRKDYRYECLIPERS